VEQKQMAFDTFVNDAAIVSCSRASSKQNIWQVRVSFTQFYNGFNGNSLRMQCAKIIKIC